MNKELQKYELAMPVGSLDSYIHWAHQIPLLTPEEEIDLANRYLNEGDLNAAKRMVMSHMRYVISVAKGYMGYGLALGDLAQEGAIGLMKAVKRFDPTKGVRLVSYAVHWIKAEIHEFILRNWRIVKIATTKAQRKLFFNLRKSTKHKQHEWLTDNEVKMVANQHTNVAEKDVRQMEQRLYSRDVSFDPLNNDDEDWSAPANYLVDKSCDPARTVEHADWAEQREGGLHAALSQLDERSQDILEARWLAEDKATLHDLAAKYNISAERIRQLEKNAMNKVKIAMLAEAA